MNSTQTSYVITLVHGTWGRKASWSTPNSRLWQMLQGSLLDLEAIVPFQWSGRNTVAARKRAAEELQTHLWHLIDLTVVFWLMIDDLSSRHGRLLLGK